MNLLFVSNYYPPYHNGGYEELCAEVREGLMARGHSVAVMTSRRGVSEAPINDGIFRVLHNEIDYQSKSPNTSSIFRQTRKQKENETQILKTLALTRPTAAVVWGMWNLWRGIPALLEAQPGLHVVYYIADYWPRLPSAVYQHWKKGKNNSIRKRLRRMAGQVILAFQPGIKDQIELKFEKVYCVSQAVQQNLVADSSIPRGAQVLYNGINLDKFTIFKERLSPRDGNLRFVYSGRIEPDKGVHTILEAMGKLKSERQEPRLRVIGSGYKATMHNLHTLVEQYGLKDQVIFMGRVPREKVAEILAEEDIMLAPSTWEEPMPRSIQEAMALGLAVIASRVGGIPEIVQHGVTGLTFPPGDSKELAARMKLLIQQPELIQQYAQAGRRLVEKQFDIRMMVDRLEGALLELAG